MPKKPTKKKVSKTAAEVKNRSPALKAKVKANQKKIAAHNVEALKGSEKRRKARNAKKSK